MTAQPPDDAIRREGGHPTAVLAAGAGLTEIPDAIAGMRRLRHIDLDGNAISRLPASVATLPQLHTLLLYNNDLTGLPGEFGPALRHLSVGRNHLTALPGALWRTTTLHSLNVAENNLAELPDTIRALSQLRMLDLSNNQLRHVPAALGVPGRKLSPAAAYSCQSASNRRAACNSSAPKLS